MAEKPTYEELEKQVQILEKEKADRFRTDAKVRESESSFFQLFDLAPVPMAYASETDGYTRSTWNAAWYKTFKYPWKKADGRSGKDIGLWVNPDDRFRLVDMANSQNYVTNFETLLKRYDGAIRNCSLFGRFIQTRPSRLLMVIYFDITERKQAEKELNSLRNSLSNIINSMPSILIGVDARIRVTQWNKKAAQYTGVTGTDAQGKNLSDVFPQMVPQLDIIKDSIKNQVLRQRSKIARHFDGGTVYEDITIYPLTDNGAEGAVIRLDDVTEKVHMEKMMMQSEKMLSLGGLAAGMAHEINNPLAGMIQTADVLSNRLTSRPDIPANARAAAAAGTSTEAIENYMNARGILSMVATIKTSGIRIANIVENMLNFVRKSDTSIAWHDPVDLVDKTLELAATDYDLKKHYDFKTIEIVKAYEDNLPEIPCHGASIQQVLLNILRNGAQAMQENMAASGGKRPKYRIRLLADNEFKGLRIEIQDNGPGMDEDTSRRIFEPFFTTKPVGVGTGLGLYISYFIVTENHGGQMRVASAPGSGTTFVILLPYHRAVES